MEQEIKDKLNKLFNEDNKLEAKTVLVIKARPKLVVDEESDYGMELNDGYEFEVNAALPEIADGIAKLAIELPKNGFGEGSDTFFLSLINEYYKRLSSSTDVK